MHRLAFTHVILLHARSLARNHGSHGKRALRRNPIAVSPACLPLVVAVAAVVVVVVSVAVCACYNLIACTIDTEAALLFQPYIHTYIACPLLHIRFGRPFVRSVCGNVQKIQVDTLEFSLRATTCKKGRANSHPRNTTTINLFTHINTQQNFCRFLLSL